MELILLAAGKGSRIFNKINKNKCLIKIKNLTLIEKIIRDFQFHENKNKSFVVVGYRKENIKNALKKYQNISFINNNLYATREMLYSLKLGLMKANSDVIISYTDIFYSKNLFSKLRKIKNKNEIVLPINKNWKKTWSKRKKSIFDDCESLKYDKNYYLIEIGKNLKSLKDAMGQFMGIIYIPKNKISKMLDLINKCNKNKKMHTTNFIDYIIKKNEKIKCLPIYSNWYEFDDYEDLKFF
ncbi:NTP transferase domain-containing protein [Candidatus Pelagibacter sp. HIMB1748]|uniref:phosphocholine cytidylyltransferase family protein n=1 Tax=unclassified Candidatus Pelagibacter TaxID=2647897 RepID=UPI003F876760